MNKEEKDIQKSLESGKWQTVKNIQKFKKRLKTAAKNTLLKDQRMNIRIAKRDLDKLKVKALEEGLPYQTLVSSVLHKYVSGKLKDKSL
jgi:predicted DNA binding CopG/RHH family protein